MLMLQLPLASAFNELISEVIVEVRARNVQKAVIDKRLQDSRKSKSVKLKVTIVPWLTWRTISTYSLDWRCTDTVNVSGGRFNSIMFEDILEFIEFCLTCRFAWFVYARLICKNGIHLYSALSGNPCLRRSGVDQTVFTLLRFTTSALPRSSPGGATTEWTVVAPADEAYYSLIDPVRMKGWVGLVGWPTAEGLING